MNKILCSAGTILLVISILLLINSSEKRRDSEIKSEGEVSDFLEKEASELLDEEKKFLANSEDTDSVITEEDYWELSPRPFAVAHSSDNFEWTAEDGTRPELLRRVFANNPDNLDYLLEQNAWVIRRQLIYLPEDFQETAEGIYRGEIKDFVIPGFDGEEFAVKIGEVVILDPSMGSYFYGVIEGEPDSVVYAAWLNHTWDIGMDRPSLETTYRINSRREGEWVLSESDPKAYAAAMGDERGTQMNINDTGDPIE